MTHDTAVELSANPNSARMSLKAGSTLSIPTAVSPMHTAMSPTNSRRPAWRAGVVWVVAACCTATPYRSAAAPTVRCEQRHHLGTVAVGPGRHALAPGGAG